ncbi:hypothetical protein [Streptomyces sp. NPDC053079]|uniref:hypothetical protein n=1 Tax=Streptomyces sp. NPDC053079 TaxID=3365697 RepID=UPI0037D5A3B1
MHWPGFSLSCGSEGRLEFVWESFGVLDAKLERCVAATFHSPGPDSGCQLIFRFRFSAGGDAQERQDLVVVRVDAPARQAREAQMFMNTLWLQFGVPDQPEERGDDTELERVPDGPGWIVAPAGPASEELFEHVMARISRDTD